jgi:hypothetical protein
MSWFVSQFQLIRIIMLLSCGFLSYMVRLNATHILVKSAAPFNIVKAGSINMRYFTSFPLLINLCYTVFHALLILLS